MTRRAAGLALLLLAIAAPAARWLYVQSVEWTPIEIPLSRDRGARPSHEFSVDHAGKYELAVRIDTPPTKTQRDQAECLLGFDRVECAGVAAVEIRPHLTTADGAPVRCTDPVGGGRFTSAAIERWLTCFDAFKGERYDLRVDVPSGAGALAPFRPRLIVTASAELERAQQSRTAAIWLTALFVGLAGFLLADNRS